MPRLMYWIRSFGRLLALFIMREFMHTIGSSMTRRSFLKLPALLPFSVFGSALPVGGHRPPLQQSTEHHFQYECVVGTSMDLVVWTPHSHVAERACRIVLQEIDRLASILNTRDPASEISLLEDSKGERKPSRELENVFD